MELTQTAIQLFLILSVKLGTMFALEIKEVVEELNRINEFQTILCFASEEGKDQLNSVMLEVNATVKDTPKFIYDLTFKDINIRDKFNLNVLSLVFMKEDDIGMILEILRTTLKGNLLSKIVFIFLKEAPVLNTFMERIWNQGLFYSLVMMGKRVFTFYPYPSFNILEITTAGTIGSVLAKKLLNLHGYTVKVVQTYDISNSVRYKDRHGKVHYGGIFMKMVLAFLDKYNGTFIQVDFELAKEGEILNSLTTRSVDIFPFLPRSVQFGYLSTYSPPSYPPCILVPYQKELPRMYYLLLPFQPSGWILFGGGILILSLVFAVTEFLHRKAGTFWWQEVFLQVWRILTQQIHISVEQQENHCFLSIHLLATLLLMLLLSLYQSGLSSFYTKSIDGEQIETAEDLGSTDYIVLMPSALLGFFHRAQWFPSNVLKHFVGGPDNVTDHLNNLNPKLGYLASWSYNDYFRGLEKSSSTRYFHVTKICSRDFILGVLIPDHFPYREVFNEFIFRFTDFGLTEKWEKDIVYESNQAGCLKFKMTSESTLRPLTFHELHVIWVIYAIGLLLATVAFCIERFCSAKPNRTCRI